MSIQIPPEARRMAKGTGLDRDEGFVLAVATALADLGANARRAEVIEAASAQRIRDLTAERDAADAEGRKAGAMAERQRIRAILEAREAEGREEVARSLAFASDMPAAAAIEALKMAPTKPAWPAPAAQPAEPPKLDGILRAANAPGGLIATDPQTGEPVSGIVSSDPRPPRKTDPIKAMWKETIAGINREAGAQAAAK